MKNLSSAFIFYFVSSDSASSLVRASFLVYSNSIILVSFYKSA